VQQKRRIPNQSKTCLPPQLEISRLQQNNIIIEFIPFLIYTELATA